MSSKEINLNSQSTYKSAPRWSIPNRVPPRELGKGMPGPGNYNNTNPEKDKFSTNPKWSIASGMRDGKEWATFPGPGQYTPAMCDRTMLPKWSSGSETRLHEIKQRGGPGPGAYETRGNLEGLQFSVCSRPEAGARRSGTPGPGSYKPSFDQIFHSPCKPSFGSSNRSELAQSKTPGPGQYELPTTLCGNFATRSSAKYSIAGKYRSPGTDQTPGPGASATQFAR